MQAKEVYIYGAGNQGWALMNLINDNYYDMIHILGFIDKNKQGYLKNYKIFQIDECIEDKPIVISIANFEVALDVAIKLRKEGFDKVYWYNIRNKRKVFKDFFYEQCVSCDEWNVATLFHVEMHAMDACNLNCRGCTHYAPIFNNEKPNTKCRLSDIDSLSRKVKSIVNFYILGGEPFLNDELAKYIEKVKEVYPKAAVTVVTNGLLIPRCSAEILSYISENNIYVSISEYEPTHRIIDNIIEVLEKYNIIYTIRKYDSKQKFNLPLSMHKTDKSYCISKGCINIWNGKIACCPTLMYISELNFKFGLTFPEDGISRLEDIKSDIQLKNDLQKNVPLCAYCSKNEIDWSICGKNVCIQDFVAEK